jgi:outer membrane protein OmpA-like peptidoglycan-associated protein
MVGRGRGGDIEMLSNVLRQGLIAAVAAAAVVGCQALDPYTGEERASKTVRGAGAGAIGGAIVGIITGDDARERRKRALIGAGVGAIAGGAVGQYMDRKEARLREQLADSGVSVTRVGDNITLNMPGNITFATDSADLRPAFFDVLNSVATVLQEFDQTLVEVAGHTDSTGPADYNQRLSERRAGSVAQYLQSRGINGQRILTAGGGENYPVATNATPDGREQNRRVELSLEPITRG